MFSHSSCSRWQMIGDRRTAAVRALSDCLNFWGAELPMRLRKSLNWRMFWCLKNGN
jgi:hypothetical protein